MDVLIIGLVALAVVALLATYGGRSTGSNNSDDKKKESDTTPSQECCGTHPVCETDILAKLSEEIVYYEDQELDAYKDFRAEDYSNEQIDEFREVLYSLRKTEINGWLHSLQLRDISLPSIIKSELVFMMLEKTES